MPSNRTRRLSARAQREKQTFVYARNLHLEPRENSKEMGLCREGWMYAKGSMHIHPKKAYYTMYGSSLDEEMCGCRYREGGK
jgi:hypothetical protein